jgi:hypothetical protein
MTLRFALPPGGDVPPASAARRMGLSLEAFCGALPDLVARGFPAADPTTGNYCLEAIDAWRTRGRYPQLLGDRLTPAPAAREARDVVRDRVAGIRSVRP